MEIAMRMEIGRDIKKCTEEWVIGYSCDTTYIDATMYMASIDDTGQRKAIRCAVTVGVRAHYMREKNNMDLVAAFCLFIRTSLINFALHGGNVIE
jgi:hypothetical protein